MVALSLFLLVGVQRGTDSFFWLLDLIRLLQVANSRW